MKAKLLFLFFLTIVFIFSFNISISQEKVKQLLEEIDRWAIKDTAKILANADSANKSTLNILKSSKYWDEVYRDLSFLLGIDLTSRPQIDNTGRIYFLMRITGDDVALFYSDSPMGFPVQLTPNSWFDEGLSIGNYYVHPSGEFVIVAVMKFVNENYDLYYFSRNGKFKPLLINPEIQYSNIVFKEKNLDKFFLMADDRKGGRYLCKYSISENKLDTLYSDSEWIGISDYRNGKLIIERWFSFSESQLIVLDEAELNVKEITPRGLFYGGFFTNNGDVITLTSQLSTKEEFTKFVIIPADKPDEFKLIYDPEKETDEYFYSRETGIITALLNNDGYSEIVAFDENGNKVDVPAIPIGVASSITGNDLGDICFGFSSPQVPPVAYLFKLGLNELKQVTKISTFGFDFSKVKVDVIRYKSTDGFEIPALIYIPENAKKDSNNLCLVSYHGGPPSQSRPYFLRNIAFALGKGMIVMFPNVRGSTGYGPAYEEADNLEGRKQALKDAESALDYLVNEGWTTYDKIAIMGASYGGYTVNWLATNAPEKFGCVISQVGVADIDHAKTHGILSAQKIWEKEYGPIGSPLTREMSPVWYAENVQRPILITTGYNDRRVPASDPRRFSKVLQKLGKDVMYYEELEAGHWASSKAKTIEEYTMYYTFIFLNLIKD